MSEAPHPRETFAYEGGEAVEAAFLEARARGRLHHAWLLTGPEGVGKATFAYRAARRLLGARPDERFGVLGSSPDDPVSRQVASRSHPDLMVLERESEDGKARKYIAVDDARRLPEFFAKAPASAPFRVAIIDAADDMNVNAANALLKTLEEPPVRGVLFLVSHAPGGLIATIRSRCRRLAFPAWDEARVTAFLEARTGADAESALRLARMARGAPGRALQMAEGGALDADAVAREILTRLPGADDAALLAVADSFRGAEGQKRFELLFDRLQEQVRAMATQAAEEGASAETDRWARAWDSLIALPREAEAVNLDRADAFFTAIGRLRQAAKRDVSGRMLIDSHVNLHAPQFAGDQAEVIARARAAGVGLMVTICDKVSSFEAVHAIAMAHDDIWATVGTHPHEAKENPFLSVRTLIDLAARPKVVGIGECGLDFHYDLSPRDIQAEVFRVHVQAARETGLPLVVHTREADAVMAGILKEEHAKAPFKLLMHCYTSGPELAELAAGLGAWFSVAGIATFKAAEEVRSVIRDLPQDRIIVETDCPYLAPVPHRGRRNEPAYIPHILAKLAEIREWSMAEAEARTTDAFFDLFHTIPRPAGT